MLTAHDILETFESPEHIDLDQLRNDLQTLAEAESALAERTDLYETELQRELRAKVDLCGPVPSCPTAESAFDLHDAELLRARREASVKFNDVFFMAPISRRAQRPSLADLMAGAARQDTART